MVLPINLTEITPFSVLDTSIDNNIKEITYYLHPITVTSLYNLNSLLRSTILDNIRRDRMNNSYSPIFWEIISELYYAFKDNVSEDWLTQVKLIYKQGIVRDLFVIHYTFIIESLIESYVTEVLDGNDPNFDELLSNKEIYYSTYYGEDIKENVNTPLMLKLEKVFNNNAPTSYFKDRDEDDDTWNFLMPFIDNGNELIQEYLMTNQGRKIKKEMIEKANIQIDNDIEDLEDSLPDITPPTSLPLTLNIIS